MKLFPLLLLLLIPVSFLSAQDDYYHPELEWRTIETPHFLVHYHNGTARTAQTVAKIAEDVYGPVTALYHHEPDSKVSFVIKDYDDYSNGGAYFFDNKIEIWASALDFDLRGTHNWLRNVITHEFTHIVQIQTTLKFGRRVPAFYLQWLQYENERRTDVLYGYPNGIVSYPISGYVVPAWFAEGVAQYNRRELGYDSWDTHRDMILRMYALDDNMLSWNEMAVFGKTSLGNESSYNAGFAFVHYIAERYGEDKLFEISKNLSSLNAVTIDGAIGRALGKSGEEVYNEWRATLRSEYRARMAAILPDTLSGSIIGPVGFGNFYPSFSPDGKSIAYVSNKNADYFSLSSIYLYDIATKTEKKLQMGVRSALSWSADGKKLYYAKLSRKNDHGSNLLDLYSYDIASDDETRLTHGLRGGSPSLSPDGKTIAFAGGSDGTINLFTMNIDGSNVRQLTHYTEGEQIYSPKWSPDGSTIIFSYSIKDGRDIATIPASGGDVAFLLASPDDERDASFTSDGRQIVYSSDRSGIFNLYRYDPATKTSAQLTNVPGGAFMPAVNASGQITFATYTSGGYKLAFLESPKQVAGAVAYLPAGTPMPTPGMQAYPVAPEPAGAKSFDWKSLHAYDDTGLKPLHDTEYTNTATSISFIPFLRLDNYNPKNKGYDNIKPGLYAYSYDVLDRYGFFGGAAINRKGERDLFFTFEYHGKVPGLYQLGLEPAVSFEVYNLSRETNAYITLPLDTIPVDISYNLIEFDFAMKQKVFSEAVDAEVRYAHSRYTASIGMFFLPESNLSVSATSTLYYIGNDISTTWTFNGIIPSRTGEINPVGRKLKFRYDYEFNKFNPTDTINSQGELVHLYQNPSFHRVEGAWKEYLPLPGWSHTLGLELRGGSIIGQTVDEFFNFYIGGLAGMKGYPFYSMGGNRFASANVTYRFPIIPHIDVRFLQLYFDKLYGAVYGDVGSAWTDGSIGEQKFKRDAGAELRLESFSYYAFPTRIFFNATYGFDRFNYSIAHSSTNEQVTYGKEWNFHFGVLFGFDFD
jgi:Tol biopolymer transport system component